MMKHKTPLISIIAMLLSAIVAYADDDYVISLTKDYDPYQINGTTTKHRSQSKPVTCTITPDGVNIISLSSDDIYLFEVYDLYGNCIESFTSEHDFVDFVFSSSGEFVIRLYVDDYVLKGAIEL
jgi:DNA modification methylase